ncbi:MAG: DegT/DnrJ/EryC1/StrS family aminotransferase [Blautia sp.]|nr:DegT/DnrJ/EryC1/StrS family aminotransferase [Blautia sp.]
MGNEYKKIALAGPDITEKEIEYVVDAVRNGWYETYDKDIRKLERTFAEMVGVKYAIATYCGTHALHLATIALGLQPGDEVIVTDQSYIATAQAISYVGATCVFVDICPETLCINPGLIEQAITEKTKAIMLVHFAGMSADMDRIMEIAGNHHLKVIEDACQMVGGRYKGRYCGTIGDIGAFSFQGSKIAVGGEGGMFVTDDEALYKRALHYGTFCRNDSIDYLWSDDVGYNYRISNVTAALILAQIERLDELVAKKKQIYEWYHVRFQQIAGIDLLKVGAECESNYAYVVGFVNESCPVSRDTILKALQKKNIWARPGYPSMSAMPNYDRRFSVPISEKFWKAGITLPSALNLTEEDVDRVCREISEIISA